jgi:transcription-repair coupling factor (superfamily II helicase)
LYYIYINIGDVGFGKTEVAFRAIYRAILSGRQVAFLSPTIVLAMQHEQSAKLRFPSHFKYVYLVSIIHNMIL